MFFYLEEDGVIGTVPQAVLVDEQDYIRNSSELNFNLVSE